MRTLVGVLGVLFFAVITVRVSVGAQTVASPAWAYGVPPAEDAPAPPPGAGPAGPRQPDTSLKHIPGSSQEFTLAHIRDYWDVGDWFPDDHPAMPNVVVHGRQPHVRGCAMCHMPNGKGRPENAPVAGQSYSYYRAAAHRFQAGAARQRRHAQDEHGADDRSRHRHDRRRDQGGRDLLFVDEMDAMDHRARGGDGAENAARRQRLPASSGHETEPIGNRIIEAPLDVERFELRDPRSGFIAYVPPGSLKKGAALVASGAGKTTPCGSCHGLDLNGLGPVPAIAGRSPSYLVRQLWDFKQGSRKGAWSPLMKPVVENLTQDDMLAIAAYVAAQGQ